MSEPELVSYSWAYTEKEHIHVGFPHRTSLYVDGGKLDLGIVRDSTLNATNSFQVFGQAFVNIAASGLSATQAFEAAKGILDLKAQL